MVQRLDVGEGVGELVAGDAHLVGGETVKHEGIVGVGAVGDLDLANFIGSGGSYGGHWFLGLSQAAQKAAAVRGETFGRKRVNQALMLWMRWSDTGCCKYRQRQRL